MRKVFAVIISFCLVLTAVAQRSGPAHVLDSLLKVLATSKEDTSKAMLLLTLANLYETNNQDSAEYYLQKGKALSEALKFDKGIYYYYQQGTVLSYTKGNYAKALDESNKGLEMARKLKDTLKVITMLNNLGIISAYQGNYQGQLEYALQVKDAVESVKDSSMLSGAYHNLANCYHNLGQFRKAVETSGYSIYVNGLFSEKNMYINRVYATLGQSYEGLRMADSALFYYSIAIKESVRLNDKYAEGSIYGYMCNLYAGMNRFGDMLKAAEKSLSLSKELQSRQMMASSLYNIAYAQFLNNNNKEAYKSIKEALSIAVADSLGDELKNCYTVLSYIAARDGDYVTSVSAKQKADSIADASLNEKVLKSTADLEKKYETEKKDNQIKLQQAEIKRKSTLNYILIGSAVALVVVSFLSYRNYRQKQKLQQQRIYELETEKKLAATEAVLKGEEQERTRLAKDLHDGLGGMLSGIKYSFQTMKGNLIMTPENHQAFERSMDMLDSSIREMRRVAHNMMPEALVKFGLDTALKDFCTDINQTGALNVSYQSIGMETSVIEQTTAITIYRIVQELINNTMKHAAAKNAIVQVSRTNGILSVTVEDDGKGFDTAVLSQVRGIGWDNIKNRVEFLKGTLDVDSQPGKGTSVHIELNT
ncbi:MAG TPA: sensor histidine kinase [Chitinophagaceae bacterium]|nr:sensor histidine kinase [Chitinophagaceae bacterium]HQV84537.1 sensor histidine kinase [Chitinophagaceae bacterium]HQX73912.1 sensor histidine kinase [Chitinophagaceae bacterium]HQZ73508.1 sensor histidine kinase [Chitinophagaceae bacterium]